MSSGRLHYPHFNYKHASIEQTVLDKLTCRTLLTFLTPEEQEILVLWAVEELSFAEIGEIVGLKYRGRVLSGSAVRYHKKRIVNKLQQYR